MSRFAIDTVFGAKDRFGPTINRMKSRFRGFGRNAATSLNELNTVSNRFLGGLRNIGIAAGAAGVAIGGMAAHIIGVGADFDQAMSGVAAVMLKPKAELTGLRDLAKDLGATTKFTATEAASGMEIMARAGFETKDIMSGIPGVLSAAAASGLELAEVSDHVSNVLKGMGMNASRASDVADVLALASARTNSTIGTLGESMRNVSSTARQLKIPLVDVVAGVASLQDVGLDASVAGSAMNTMLTKLAAPSDTMAKKLTQMGVKFKDSEGNALSFVDIIGNISKASKAAGGNMDQVALLAELVGLRGQKAAANLAQLFETGKLQKLQKELENARGSAKKMGEERLDNLRGDMTLMASAIDAVKTALFETQDAPLRGVVQGITEWVGANQKLIVQDVEGFIQRISDNMPTILKWGKKIGIIVGIFTAVAVAVKIAAAAMFIFNAVMTANPITLIALAIVGAIALIVAFWPEITAFFSDVWSGIKDIASRVVGAVSGIIDSVKGPVMNVFKGIGEFVMGWIKIMFLPLWPLFALVKFTFNAVKEFIIANWGPISAWFEGFWQGIKDAFEMTMNGIMAVVDFHVDAIKLAWEGLSFVFLGVWKEIKKGFDLWFGPIIDGLGWFIDKVREVGRSDFFSFGGDDEGADQSMDTSNRPPRVQPQVITPSERVSRSVSESIETSSAEISVRAEPGTGATMTKAPRGRRINVSMQPSGAF